jgi:cytochrome c
MDSMEVTKVSTAVLVAGIAFFLSGTIGALLVSPEEPAKTAIAIKGAETTTSKPKAPAPLPPIAPFLANASAARGEKDFKTLCSACHTANEGGPAGVGPNLYGVVGGPHAHMKGFDYSAGLKAQKGPWTLEELNHWIHNPRSVVPGTRMGFAGIRSEKERADVIMFLRSLSHNPVPLPPAK